MPVEPAAGRSRRRVGISSRLLEIDARIVAAGLGIAPQEVEPARLAGTITTLCERGTGEDAGLVRATFYLGRRRLRVLIDAQGRVIEDDARSTGPAQPEK